MDARVRRMRDTNVVYNFERHLSGPTVPIAVLRLLAERIWRENTGRRDRCPRIMAGRGVMMSGKLASYCEGRCLIVLSRTQRDRVTLIHEMTHALGPETHGPRFQKRYAALLGAYW